jgi:hypothetical protein
MAVQHLADPERKRFDDKRLFHVRICRCIEPLAQQPVYSSFEGLFGAPHSCCRGRAMSSSMVRKHQDVNRSKLLFRTDRTSRIAHLELPILASVCKGISERDTAKSNAEKLQRA